MKNAALALLFICCLPGCSTPSTNQASDNANTSSVQSSGGGNLMHYESQYWNNGIHFCTYTDGLDKVIKQIDNFEKCPSEVTDKK